MSVLLLFFLFLEANRHSVLIAAATTGNKKSIIKPAKINDEWRTWRGCIDSHTAKFMMQYKESAMQQPQTIINSINLGISNEPLKLTDAGLVLPDSKKESLLATWEEIEMISNKKQGCYALFDDDSKPWHISALSGNTGRYLFVQYCYIYITDANDDDDDDDDDLGIPASLCAPLESTGAPTMVLGGFTMHRISGDGMNPTVDTDAKIASLKFLRGAKVLDTCCGLGYTAVGAAKRVVMSTSSSSSSSSSSTNGHVTTIEYDEASLEMCAFNPWSQGLFDGTLPITVLHGDSCEAVRSFADKSFNIVLHDPPARNLCRTDLYSLEFYKDLRRVLTSSGTLYHYIGNPSSKESGRLYSGIISRLQDAGFKNIKKVERAFGVTAVAGSNSGGSNSNNYVVDDDDDGSYAFYENNN